MDFRKFVKCFEDRQNVEVKTTVVLRSAHQRHLPDSVGAKKKTSTSSTSDRRLKQKTTNLNLTQGKRVDILRTTTSYFDETGMYLCNRKMVQFNGFPNRLLELVRIFTVRLMMTR